MHIEFFVEEPSAEAALINLAPALLPQEASYAFHVFNGKPDLLKKAPQRLRAYRRWIPGNWRIVVLIDEDRRDCRELKARLERTAIDSGFVTKSSVTGHAEFQVLNRITVEELEAWFLGDVEAITSAYPRVSAKALGKPKYQDSDAIAGGTAEALEQVMKKAGYYPGGMPKIEVAARISSVMDPMRNRSRSFQVFREGLAALA